MTASILSIRLDGLNLEEVKARITGYLADGGFHMIVPVNPEFIMAARHDPELTRITNSGDLTVADGVGLKYAARIVKADIGQRITGVDLTYEIARIASEKGYSMFLLGAGNGVAEKAAQKLTSVHPSLRIAGTYAGSPTEPGVVERINNSGADILLVAFGVPKQEKFIYANKERLNVSVAMCVGGTFDFIAGIVPRAPGWMRSAGLEWVFRLIKQPQRLNRIITATVRFPLAVVTDRKASR